MRQYHVGVAAEAFAAGLFAQSGCDVLVQYGANQPLYDLMITRGGVAIHVSVKGSQDGGWGLIQSYKRGMTYVQAADAWAAAHRHQEVVYCLVQFQGIGLGECPRVYLATISEIVNQHKTSRKFLGGTILYENYCYKKGVAKGCTDMIPAEWRFSLERLSKFYQPRICHRTNKDVFWWREVSERRKARSLLYFGLVQASRSFPKVTLILERIAVEGVTRNRNSAAKCRKCPFMIFVIKE